jgi:hypothetical protein
MAQPPRPKLGVKAAAKHAEPPSDVAAEISAPTEEGIRTVLARVEEAFFAMGTDKLPGTIIPVGQKNNAAEAAEFVIADRLAKLAATRLKNASEAAEKAGVFGDKSEYVEGETVMVFSDPNFTISMKMGRPSKTINREKVEEAAAEFLPKRSGEFLERCFKDRAATKTIIVSMK